MKENKKTKLFPWLIQFIKGMFIGSGAILPGVSGGALTAIFGLYEPIISFLADIKKNFLTNILYFLPVGLGGLFGVFVLATPIDYALNHYPVHLLWTFMGIIIGTLPFLYKEAGKKGRSRKDFFLLFFTTILAFLFMHYGNRILGASLGENLFAWILAGFIFALGFITPGLSSASFLIYLNLYQPITKGISSLNFSILLPLVISGLLSILFLSKVMRFLMDRAYASVFHVILGLVIASTIIIAPEKSFYLGYEFFDYFLVFLLFLLGLAFGYYLGQLEEKHR